MKLTLVFLIFGSVIAAGRALCCETCKVIGDGVDNCQGDIQKCKNVDDFCATQIEYNMLRGDKIQTIRKRCMPIDQAIICDKQSVLNTTDEYQYLVFSKCCYLDGCNKEGIQMPPVNLTKNHLSCQSCFVEGSFKCTEFGTVNCTGTQLQCFNFTGIAALPGYCEKPFAFHGCVTIGSCLVDHQNLAGSRVDKNAVYTCKGAKFDGLPSILKVPTIV